MSAKVKNDTENMTGTYKLRLFVTGNAPNSRIAQQNLRKLCERYPDRVFNILVVDVADNPQAALENNIYLTPALQIIEPEPGTIIFGNLNNKETLESLFL